MHPLKDQPTWLDSRLIMLGIHGSLAYGMARPESDEDYRGIVVPPTSYYLGLDSYSQIQSKDPDLVIYELRKFFHLAMKNNPNLLELLFLPREMEIRATWEWTRIKEHRYEFLSKRAGYTYIGYAQGEMSSIEKDLVKTGTFKGKQAAHLVRIVRMGTEILREGVVRVKRPDYKELLDIRAGLWDYDKLKGWFNEAMIELKEARESSKLPEEPDYDKMNELCISTIESFIVC